MAPNIFEGDVLINGRFGQSIRLSTTLSEGANETWRGEPDLDSDPPYLKPITIIRNGMPEELIENAADDQRIDRYIDNLSTDPAAIYLTNGQYIPELKELKPFPLDHQDKPRTREIYQWGEKGVSIATPGAVTIDAGPMTIIDSDIINLGSGAGEGPDDMDLSYAVRGEKLQEILLTIVDAFSQTTCVVGGMEGSLVPLGSVNDLYDEIVDGQNTGLFSKKVFLE